VIAAKVTRDIMLSDKILRLRVLGHLDVWVLHVLRSLWGRAEIERLASGNQESMRNIGQERLRAIRIPLPPAAEVERACAEISRQLSSGGSLEQSVETAQRRSSRLRQALLAAAFEGKLTPSGFVEQVDTGPRLSPKSNHGASSSAPAATNI
jgi:type I restriction enzyme S subunit